MNKVRLDMPGLVDSHFVLTYKTDAHEIKKDLFCIVC